MTLDNMCRIAARMADRSDELVKTADETGATAYRGEAALLFNLFRDAINEAYMEIARSGLMPGRFAPVTVPPSRIIRLDEAAPDAAALMEVWSADHSRQYDHRFVSRFDLRVPDARAGETVLLHIHTIPAPLVAETDEPVFSEAVADPMIYVSLAVTRLWQSERRLAAAQIWHNEYYRLLRTVRSSAEHPAGHRLACRWFR
ncbi:MAG: hypothetical protein IJ048_12445 [Clostridia bacterium]|nr:hypothetical protein [Clostridia bacterium]